jgi:hypothetical protein
MKRCTYCKQTEPAIPKGLTGHEACIEAYGLDHDPKSDNDAREFLDRRRVGFGQVPRWTKLYAFTPVVHSGGHAVGLVKQDSAGYWPWESEGVFKTRGEARERCDVLNAEMGISRAEELEIVASSMNARDV